MYGRIHGSYLENSPKSLAANGTSLEPCEGDWDRTGVFLLLPDSNGEISLTGILTDPENEFIVKVLFRSWRSSLFGGLVECRRLKIWLQNDANCLCCP